MEVQHAEGYVARAVDGDDPVTRLTRHELRSDGGFTLIELIIASVVGLLVLGASYLLFETGMIAFRDINNTTTQTRTAEVAVTRISRPLREGVGFTKARDYEVEFTAESNNPTADRQLQRWRFYQSSGSTNLMVDVSSYNTTTSAWTTAPPAVVGDGIRNITQGVPLFAYYSAVNVPITGSEADKAKGVKIVHLRIIEQAITTPLPAPYQIDTEIFLRNSSQ